MAYDFDLFVIGAGSGGIATARRAAEYGAKVGIAEFDRLGGTCVNRGCVPKKLMVYASRFPGIFEESQGYGWSPVQSSLNWEDMITRVNNEVIRLNGIYQRMLDNSKVQVFQGRAKFVDSHTVEIGDTKVTADKILIAVGGTPVRPDIPGIEHALISDALFELKTQPKRVVLLGGGYIGSEFACILHGLGTEVIQVIRHDKILRGFDEDLRTEIQEGMIRHGIRIINNADIVGITKTDSGVSVTVKTDTEENILADAISLAALGRKPNTDNLGLENTSVKVDSAGMILVDGYSRTAAENIYAVGDCTSKIQLTPVAINEGRAFADTVFGGKSRVMSYENIPTAIFTTPEAATVGLTEAEAIEKYGSDRIKIYRSRFRPMYYTLPGKEEKTLMKLVVNTETDQVLGAHMVGDHAGEIIQGIAIAVKMGAKKADFDATVGIHPSSAEEFVTMR
ncbi:NADPH-glutathione reductase [Nostoc sp. PCC 7524]|uniref:glutathione-disulfide reductase n=1 Tax=Nostoc sp. (strain ATCC 29411 / PCC 7524) TaxID=28072 RepID=UPI00029EC60C|nr:glutathione-disulfide reductase [Nostoc sp. PCC 7524]AFY47636.1 NADPH-glutathione reductase [Nostoc sp. PCC 7524]